MKYPGGKSKEAEMVRRYMPQNINRYIEPFVGGGSIFFALDFPVSCLNDLSVDLIHLYGFIQRQTPAFLRSINSINALWHGIEADNHLAIAAAAPITLRMGHYPAYYQSSLRRKNRTIERFRAKGIVVSPEDQIKMELTARKTAMYMCIRFAYNYERANIPVRTACYYFLREYCYSSMFRFSSNGTFNVPYGGMSYNEKYLDEKIAYITSAEMVAKMRNAILGNMDFEAFMNGLALGPNDFVFLDPPYDSDFSTYDQNPFDRNEQIRLQAYLSHTPAQWMLIIKKTDFIRDLYANFNVFEYDMNYVVSFKNRNDKEVKHLLITNYPLPGGEL